MGEMSLWQQQGPRREYPAVARDLRTDVVVIGAGVTGCACARRLADLGLSVAVLEAREVAAGASGRNGAFASTGTGLGFDALIERLGLEAAVALHRLTEAAMGQMVSLARAAGAAAAVRQTGSVWLAGEDEVEGMQRAIGRMAEAGIDCRIDMNALPERMRRWYRAAAVVEADGVLLPARWVRALAQAATDRGAAIYERSAATELSRDGEGWRVGLLRGTAAHAHTVVVACDGLIPALLPELARVIYPVRGQVLATEPLADTVITRPTHSDHGFFYYRPTDDRRVTLGGARLCDLDAEYTSQEHTTAAVQAGLDAFLSERLGIPASRVAQRWAGIMGFSADRLPAVGEIPGRPGVWVCGGYSGVGNVPGFALGQVVAERIAGAEPSPITRALDVARFVTGGVITAPAVAQEHAESRRLLERE